MRSLRRLGTPGWSRGLVEQVRSALIRSDIIRRLVSLTSWSLVSFALEKGAMILIIFMLARILGAADYGRLALAQGLVNTLQIFVVLGAGTILNRYIPEMREVSVQRAVQIVNLCGTVVLTTGVAVMAIGLFRAPMIAGQLLDLPASAQISYWMLAWVLLSSASSLLMAVMLSFERGRSLGVIAFVSAALSIVAVPLLAEMHSVNGAVAGLVAVELVKTLALGVAYVRFVHASEAQVLSRFRRSDASLLLSFGLPAFLISALWGPTMWLAQIIVKSFAPEGLIAVGVFAFTNNIFGAVIIISSLTNRAALPIMSSLQARNDHPRVRRMAWLMAAVQAGAAAVIGVPIALAAPVIMELAGPEFAEVWPVLLIMIATGVVLAGQTALGNYLLVVGRPYFLLGTMVVWTCVVLATVGLFINSGAYSLAWGLLIGAVVRTLLIAAGAIKHVNKPAKADGAHFEDTIFKSNEIT